MNEKIKNILATILEVNEERIDENSSAENIEEWDSLKHMNLIVAFEEEFEIEFTDEEIADTTSFKDFCKVIASHV